METGEAFQLIIVTFWGLVFVLSFVMGYFLLFVVGYERMFKSPGEKGRWHGPLAASFCGIIGFIASLVVFY